MPRNEPSQPYDDLPPLPPQQDLETKPVLKACLAATRALAELKGAGGLIPDQTILINAIPLQEAKASSEIENIVTTQDDLFSADIDDTNAGDPATKEVLRYRTALREGYEALQSGGTLSLEVIRQLCSTIQGKAMPFRADGENVSIGNPVARTISYTPPSGGEAVLGLLQNLESFLGEPSDSLDPLIRMAVAHYQFEAIHPFKDGNGRTGRILNILCLIQSGLLDIPVLYLSRHIIENKERYYTLLRSVTEQEDWESWLLYMLEGVESTARWTTGRIHAIRELFDQTVERVRTEEQTIYSKELVELIFRRPYCKIGFVVDAGLAKRQTASVYLQKLEALGILESEKRGRETVYRHPALLKVLAQ
ncbi:MAG: Fic family protein [Phycisphaerales bacterium]